jgi:hypothetical protein
LQALARTLMRQYLYFCTSHASKLSTCVAGAGVEADTPPSSREAGAGTLRPLSCRSHCGLIRGTSTKVLALLVQKDLLY